MVYKNITSNLAAEDLKSLPLGVAIYDKDGHQTYINDAFIEIFGIKDEKKHLSEGHNLFIHPIVTEDIKNKFHLNNRIQFEITMNYDDGSIRDYYKSNLTGEKIIRVDCNKKIDKDGKTICYLVRHNALRNAAQDYQQDE